MPKKNRNFKNYGRNQNYQSHHHNGGGSGGGGLSGGVHKWSGNKRDRRIYLNPSVIDSVQDDYDTNIPQTSGASSSYGEDRKNRKDNRRRVVDRLKDMGNVKPKLAIGESEQEAKKKLIDAQPHCKLSTMPDDVFALIVNYVQNYFNCYDANRESLLAAYNPKVTFSFALNMSSSNLCRTYKFEDSNVKESRNLRRIVGNDEHHSEKRYRLLHQGYIDTVNFISKLPPTEHEPNSFKLDSCFFTPNMISFSLTGVFKEGKPTDKVRPLRSFQRVFVCVPDEKTQMSIINEQFIVSNITHDQYKKYYAAAAQSSKQSTTASTSDSNVAYVQPQPQPQIQPPGPTPDIIERQNLMIQQFSTESRLTLEWSKYCLEHAQWNYEEAAKAFLQHKDNLPKDAFMA